MTIIALLSIFTFEVTSTEVKRNILLQRSTQAVFLELEKNNKTAKKQEREKNNN